VVILIRGGLPELPQEGKPQFFPPILPVVIDEVCERLNILHLKQIFILFLKECHNPPLTARQNHIPARLQLQLNERLPQKLLRQDSLPSENESILVTFEEDMIDLCELILAGEGEVEMRRESDIVGRYFGELLDFGDSLDCVYFGNHNLLFFDRNGFLLLVSVDDYDQALIVGVKVVECLLTFYELEGLGPIKLVAIAHYWINLKNKIYRTYTIILYARITRTY
jgi:hypothetical protein